MLEELFDFQGADMLGIDHELVKRFDDFLRQSEKEYMKKVEAAYEEKRKSFKWILSEIKHDKKFDDKYNSSNLTMYSLKNVETETIHLMFSLGHYSVQQLEEKLNSQRFVELYRYFEDRTSDKIMEECYGKNWNKKTKYADPISPYHLYSHSVIFDTTAGEVIYETPEKAFKHNYIYFYDNLAEIVQGGGNKIYFDLPNRKVITEHKDDKIETNDYIILGKSRYYNSKKEIAMMINKHTCETTILH